MSVPTKAFEGWLDAVAADASHAALCRAAGIKRSTLAQQLVRGRVSAATVAAVSRSLDIPVVEALSGFTKYGDLAEGLKAPTEDELLSQVSDTDLLQEIISRNGAAGGVPQLPAVDLAPIPHRTSVRSWIDAVGPSELRTRLSKDAGIAPQNLSAQISANRLTPELAMHGARIAGVGLGNGLVATGFLSPGEAGWPDGSRHAALRQASNSKLIMLAAARLETLGKLVRRREQDDDAVQAVWENLG